MPARTYLDEVLCNKMRQKLMFNPRETATKLTYLHKLGAQAGPSPSRDGAMFTFKA
jgi:hypothetical protein